MNYTKEQLAEMSGESAYRKPKMLQLNSLTFNGKTGSFIYRDILAGKGADGKFSKVDLGKNADVVFLKIRRVLNKYKKNEPSLQTNEHTTPNDIVMLYGANVKGKASELREKYPELRTQQVVYAYLLNKKEMVRLVVKGSSLGSNAKAKDVKGFYEYLAEFPKGEHSFEYVTKLSPVEESSDLGSYYAMKFEMGEKITDPALQTEVANNLALAFESIKSLDEYYKAADASKIVADVKEEKGITDIEIDYPEEDSEGMADFENVIH